MKPKELFRSLTRAEVSQHRFHDCSNYDDCLVLAAKGAWESFSCKECSRFVEYQEDTKFGLSGRN
jgi:hypothetical protein